MEKRSVVRMADWTADQRGEHSVEQMDSQRVVELVAYWASKKDD